MCHKHSINRRGASWHHDRLLAETFQRDHAGAEFIITAQFLLHSIADELPGFANDPATDRLVEAFAGPPIRISASHMPARLGCSASGLARLVSAVDQALVNTA